MSQNISLDEENCVALYPRNLQSGVGFYARFRQEKTELTANQYYLRKSMKTSDETLATTGVSQRYAELKILQNSDMVIHQI